MNKLICLFVATTMIAAGYAQPRTAIFGKACRYDTDVCLEKNVGFRTTTASVARFPRATLKIL